MNEQVKALFDKFHSNLTQMLSIKVINPYTFEQNMQYINLVDENDEILKTVKLIVDKDYEVNIGINDTIKLILNSQYGKDATSSNRKVEASSLYGNPYPQIFDYTLVNKIVVNNLLPKSLRMLIIYQDTDGVIMIHEDSKGSLDDQKYVTYKVLHRDFTIE